MKANLTTKCSSETQEEIRAFLNSYFRDLNITDSVKNQLVLAIDEAVANAIIHGNQSDEDKSIVIDLDISEKRIVTTISDIGLFDDEAREAKKSKELKDIIKEKQKGGLGLEAIRTSLVHGCGREERKGEKK